MKSPKLRRWKNLPETEGLLLVAQRIEEALFDYTLDTHKAPALNTHTRCIELLGAISDVRHAGLRKEALQPIVAELAHSIRQDSAAQALLGKYALHFSNPKNWSTETLDEIEVQGRQVLGMLENRYLNEIKTQLNALLPKAKEKQLILQLTTSLITEWINEGFSRDYIYWKARGFFFGKGDVFGDCTALEDFFAEFKANPRTWSAIFKVSDSFEHFVDLLPQPKFKISKEAPEPRMRRAREMAFLNEEHDGLYFEISDLSALDARSARDHGAGQLQALADYARLHVHRSPFTWSGDTLVYDEENQPVVLQKSAPATFKQPETRIGDLPKRLLKTVASLGPNTLTGRSWVRFTSALTLHSTALRSETVDSQLFSLWSALESLVPAHEVDSRIARIAEVVVPLLSSHYPRKLIKDLDHSLLSCVGPAYKRAIRDVPGGSRVEKLAAVLALDENAAIQTELFNHAASNPLLRYRIYTMKKNLRSAESIKEMIDGHSQRIEWHLRRIYRSRNLLFHAGVVNRHSETLVENLHSYLDQIISALEEIFHRKPPPKDIDGALLLIRLDHQAYIEHLSHSKKVACTPDNYMRLVFG